MTLCCSCSAFFHALDELPRTLGIKYNQGTGEAFSFLGWAGKGGKGEEGEG